MTTDVTERSSGEAEAAPASEITPPDPVRERLRTRVWLPLAIPLGAAIALALLAFNLSRVFLAGGKLGALIMATFVTLAVLGGAAWISAKPALRSSTLTLIASVVVLLVVGAGLTTLGTADDHEAGPAGFVEPEGEPVATFETVAEGNLTFRPSTGTVPAGIVEIVMNLGGGFHTFLFDSPDPAVSGFKLEVPPDPDSGKVELAEGEYVFYCDVPGHRAAGMEGTLTVTAAENGPAGTDADTEAAPQD